MATYYIKNAGHDGSTGLSTDQAWSTISRINSSTFYPGDQILFNCGDIWREQLTVTSSGDASNYITFSNYGTGVNPKILGSISAIDWTNASTNIWQSATSIPINPFTDGNIWFVETDGSISTGVHKTYNASLGFLSSPYDWTWNANTLYVYSTTDPDIQYAAVEAAQRYSIALNNKNNIEIDGIDMFYNAMAGIFNSGYTFINGLTVKNCEIAYSGYDDGDGHGIHAACSNGLFEYNTMHDHGRRAIAMYNYTSTDVSNILIQYNTFYNGKHITGPDIAAGSVTGATGDISDVIIRNNLFYEPENIATSGPAMIATYGGITATGATHDVYIYNNLFKYVAGSAIQIWYNVTNEHIYHNTFYGYNKINGGNFIYFNKGSIISSDTSIYVKNNIFYCDVDYDIDDQTDFFYEVSTAEWDDIVVDYNLYYNVDSRSRFGTHYSPTDILNTWSEFKSTTGWETNGINADPSFFSSNNYLLMSNSLAKYSGTYISDISILNDYNGTAYANPPSIGAYEYIEPSIYYVSNSAGSDSSNGLTPDTAWQTLQYAQANATAPGSIIALKKGDVWTSNYTTKFDVSHGGTLGNPIIWDGSIWGIGNNAVITTDTHFSVPLMWIHRCQNITVQNITFDACLNNAMGIEIGGSATGEQNNEANIIIQDCNFYRIGDTTNVYGVLIKTWDNSICNITVQRNIFDTISQCAIATYGGRRDMGATLAETRDIYFGHNTITNFSTDPTGEAILINNWCTNAIVEHNTITTGPNSNQAYGIAIGNNDFYYSGLLGAVPTNIIVRYNDVRTVDCAAVFLGGSQAIDTYFYSNKIYRSSYGAGRNGAIRILAPDSSADGAVIDGNYNGASFKFHNNTIVTDASSQADFANISSPEGYVEFKNNLVINTRIETDGYCVFNWEVSSLTHDHNAYWRPGAANSLYFVDSSKYTNYNRNTASTWEPTAIITDPSLVNVSGFDYHLRSNSPTIHAGTYVNILTDFDGSLYNNPPSIGAYEYSYGNPSTYYVSNDGSDNYDGRSETYPWRTIAKVNASFGNVLPGESIVFKCGDTFYGKLNLSSNSGTASNPITLTSYGTGSKPIISGLTTLTNWANVDNSIYYHPISGIVGNSSINMVVVDGVNTRRGRYPHDPSTMLNFDSATTNKIFTDAALAGTGNWVGAEAVIRRNDWILNRNLITDQTDNTITVFELFDSRDDSWAGGAGDGYFLQNDIKTLSEIGDWCYRDGSICMYFGSHSPSEYEVKTTTLPELLVLNSCNYITIKNLSFEGSYLNTINANSYANYLRIEDCSINYSGNYAIAIFGLYGTSNSDYPTINNNHIINSNNVAIRIAEDCSNAVISNNLIQNTGVFPGSFTTWGGRGIAGTMHGATIERNRIINSGYQGIQFASHDISIRYNYIDTFLMHANDGGGIYSQDWSNHDMWHIHHNIILNGFGNVLGTAASKDYISGGIYFDASSSNALVYDNIIANCANNGIKLSHTYDISCYDNILFNNDSGYGFLDGVGGGISGLVSLMTIYNNYCVAKSATKYTVDYLGGGASANIGYMDYNYYIKPLADPSGLTTSLAYPPWSPYPWPATPATLNAWKAITFQDANTTQTPEDVSVRTENDILFYYNDSLVDDYLVSLPLGTFKSVIDNSLYTSNINLAPFTASILLRSDNSPSYDPSVTTNAVTDISAFTVTSGGNVTSDGSIALTYRGVCWSTTFNPLITDSSIQDSSTGIGSFISYVSGLNASTHYHLRAFAYNSEAISYGIDVSFNTLMGNVAAPTVTTSVTDISIYSATFDGNVTHDGSISLTYRGICWGLTENPTILDTSILDASTGEGNYTYVATGLLDPSTHYHVRAFAYNYMGLSYGTDVSFNTYPSILTLLDGLVSYWKMDEPSTAKWTVTDSHGTNDASIWDGGAAWTWDDGSIIQAGLPGKINTGYNMNLTGDFSSIISDLSVGIVARTGTSINEVGGGIKKGTISAWINHNFAAYYTGAIAGNFDDNGLSNGYELKKDVSTGGVHRLKLIIGANQFDPVKNISLYGTLNASANTWLHVVGTWDGIGNKMRLYMNGILDNEMIQTIDVCLGTGSIYDGTNKFFIGRSRNRFTPAGFNGKIDEVGLWTRALTSSEVNSLYNAGSGFEYPFGIESVPTVTTTSITDVSTTTATGGGNVTSDGSVAVTDRGVCWNTSTNPTIANSHTSDSSGTGSFISYLTGLSPDTYYYVRAYAVNSAGTGYGDNVNFTTSSITPPAPDSSSHIFLTTSNGKLLVAGNYYITI